MKGDTVGIFHKRLVITLTSLVLLLNLAGCSTNEQTTDEVVPSVEESVMEESGVDEMITEATDEAYFEEGSQGTGEVRIVEVEAGSYYYEPNEIRVKRGATVKIVMTSVDMMHDFNIDELGVSIPITKNGETNEVEFTADTVGEFEFYCSVGQHRANGQVGTLIVEE